MAMSVEVVVVSRAPTSMSRKIELTPTPWPIWFSTVEAASCWLMRVPNRARDDLKPSVFRLAMLSEMTDMFVWWARMPVTPI